MTGWVTLVDIHNFVWLNWNILMQYTWLKDKNWKEIYEWDIVRIYTKDFDTLGDEIITSIWEVKFHNWSYLIMNTFKLNTVLWCDYELYYQDWLEIIWNIYDNKNLLT